MDDPPKLLDTPVELGGVRVGVRKAGPFIYCVYQVGAVGIGIGGLAGFKRRSNDREPLV